MKSILLSFASLLITAPAFAMPSIGDHAVYNTTIIQGSKQTTGTVEQVILSFDQQSGLFGIQSTMNFGGQSMVQTEQKAAQEMITDQMAAAIVANCAAYGGKPEAVTVPAGNFSTCALPTSGKRAGTMWIAAGVAFGVVKADVTQNNGTNTMQTHTELQSFENGK